MDNAFTVTDLAFFAIARLLSEVSIIWKSQNSAGFFVEMICPFINLLKLLFSKLRNQRHRQNSMVKFLSRAWTTATQIRFSFAVVRGRDKGFRAAVRGDGNFCDFPEVVEVIYKCRGGKSVLLFFNKMWCIVSGCTE